MASNVFNITSKSPEAKLEPYESSLLADSLGYEAGEVYLLNQPIQCMLIVIIILIAIICNSLVIHNIWKSQVINSYSTT
jgi:hypothetical protein